MFTTFSTALSALDANTTAVSVVGNNLANLNTTGYKDTTVAFRELMTQSLGGIGGYQVGLGTGRPQTIRQFTQGGIQSGAGTMDAAIQGQGFFVVKDAAGNSLYTRDGTFTVDKSGYVVTSAGQRVQGWMGANGVVNSNGLTGDIQIPGGAMLTPSATKNMTLNANLQSSAVVGSAEGTFSQPIQVFDSLGTAHTVTVTFTKTTGNTWDYSVTAPGADLTAGTAGTPSGVANGTVTFDANGNLLTPALAAGNIAIPITGLADGATDMNINWNLYDSSNAGRLTQVDQVSSSPAKSQDGSAAAQLMQVTMGDNGNVLAQYSNGQSVPLAQIAVAAITNPDSLISAGGNNFQSTSDTAPPVVGASGTGGRGEVLGESLEQSTVDIGTEFTNLIVLQRAYQANSRVITTEDQLTQETVNLIHA